jgi:hypothetical protein
MKLTFNSLDRNFWANTILLGHQGQKIPVLLKGDILCERESLGSYSSHSFSYLLYFLVPLCSDESLTLCSDFKIRLMPIHADSCRIHKAEFIKENNEPGFYIMPFPEMIHRGRSPDLVRPKALEQQTQ